MSKEFALRVAAIAAALACCYFFPPQQNLRDYSPSRKTIQQLESRNSSLASHRSIPSICSAPIALHLETIDPQFGLTPRAAAQILNEAIREWQDATGRPWFTLSDKNGIPVNFLFDGRQDDLNAAAVERARLEAKVKWSEEHKPISNAQVEDLRQELEKYRAAEAKLASPIPWAQHQTGASGSSIDVFAFSNRDELHATLLHELGHAMGLSHLPQKGAIMNELHVVGKADIHLAQSDIEAALSLCEAR